MFETLPVDCDETPWQSEQAVPYARRVAHAKADMAARLRPGSVVLAADTTVWVSEDPRPIGKPEHREHARTMLQRLVGRSHFVTTAWVLCDGAHELHGDRTTQVWFRPVDAFELDDYLDRASWSDKAGAYAIQEHASMWVTRIEGSEDSVVGLPVADVVFALARICASP